MTYKSVYRRAADSGWIFGVYLSVTSMLSLLSTQITIFGIITLIMMIGVPFLLFVFLRKMFIEEMGTSKFSALWMYGILLFLFGSLIAGLVTYIYLQYINPTYMYDTLVQTLNLLKSSPIPDAKDMINIIQTFIDKKLIPSPIEVVMQMIWLTTLTGSFLSIIVSGIVHMIKIKTTNF